MDKNYDFTKWEEQLQKLWEENNLYSYKNQPEGEIYSIDTPPPTVSGKIHIGHVFSYTQAEMIARFRRMLGYKVYYPFGFDDNGLPTERLVEREHGIRAGQTDRQEFSQLCRETAEKYEEEFTALWKSLGFSVDWSLKYNTNSSEIRALSQKMFIELAEMGAAYAEDAPVLWCTECQTSIAQAELDSKELDSSFNYLNFKCGDGFIPIATTRPELLYGCVCIFVNPADERYKKFVGKMAGVPLYCHEIPVIADENAEPTKGTGAVMCATFGDTVDLQWYKDYNLPYRKTVTPQGRIEKEIPFVGDMKISAARQEIIKILIERGLLVKSESITHTISVHERCGKPTEIIPSRQWYIDILSKKEQLIKAAEEINWHPAQAKARYLAWVNNLKWNWCISRQRYHGVPFPLWYCKSCGKPVFAKKLPADPSRERYEGACTCGCKEFVGETAVMDTWATSSVTPFIAKGQFPMSMRTHAHEIIRTWTFYSVVRGLYHKGQVPWKDLMINGFVLAKKGEKISKSKNNGTMSPENLIKQHSADAIRYWAANARLGTDTFFDPAELSASKRFMTKLWNAAAYAKGHLEGFDVNSTPRLLPIDRWLLEKVGETAKKTARFLTEYETGLARHEVDELFWKDYCDNFLELIKERLYQPEKHGHEQRESGRYALYHGFLEILKLYAPFVPFITEVIYKELYNEQGSIHTLKWQVKNDFNQGLLTFGQEVKELVFSARKIKSQQGLSVKTELESLEARFSCTDYVQETLGDLKACTHAREIIILSASSAPSQGDKPSV